MCNFLHLLESWQFDNRWTATAVLATKVLPLRQCLGFSASQTRPHTHTHFCHYFPLPSLSRWMFLTPAFLRFLLSESTPFSRDANFRSLHSTNLIFNKIHNIKSITFCLCPDLFPIYREIKWDSRLCRGAQEERSSSKTNRSQLWVPKIHRWPQDLQVKHVLDHMRWQCLRLSDCQTTQSL